VGVLFLNNDAGKDFLEGVQQGFGDLYKKFVVSEVAIEVTEPTVDSQIIAMKALGADVLLDTVPTKAAAQTIRKVFDMGWRPAHLLSSISASVATVLQPAGLEKSIGLLSTAYQKDPSDPRWKDDPATLEYLRFMRKYYPEGDPNDSLNVNGYAIAQTLIQVLRQCGDDLTRENVMRQATNLKNLELPMLLSGIRINTSPTDRYPLKQLQMMRFDGARWIPFGEVICHE
jgi:branched-chain amino acid transport system substrate-binding protein